MAFNPFRKGMSGKESEENLNFEGTEGVESNVSAAERIIELEQEVANGKDQLLRRTAEMENMRRRFAQEREILIFEGNKRLVTDLLTSIDDLERTLEHSNAEKSAIFEGVELVYKNIMKMLERYGVSVIETAGKAFDVHSMDALMEQPSVEVPAGTVLNEVQKGYMMNDTVLRHAKVIVSKEPN